MTAGQTTFQHHAEHPHDGVHLRQIAAGGAQLLPDIGHGINAEHLYAQICQMQNALGHVHEHCRVCIVQVPLIVVEGGQHPLVHLLAPCKVAGGRVGEHLRYGLFVLVGNGAVIVAVIIRLIGCISGFCRHGPTVGAGSVVHDEIQTQADACFAQFAGQILQILICAEGRVYRVEILHRIAAVVVGVGHLQQGHQVQVGQLLLLEVGQLLCQFFQVSGKEVGVHGHAEHIAAFVPLRVGSSGLCPVLSVPHCGPSMPAPFRLPACAGLHGRGTAP